jgi:hypothetical protein
MLGEAGIKAWPVIIRGEMRRGEEDLTLPMVDHFNHCISYVPATDTLGELYLDGTAQFHSLEELPSMDRGARVLVVRDDGGTIQQIPWNAPDALSLSEDATVTLAPDLGAEIRVRAQCRGDFAVQIRSAFEIVAQRKTDLERIFGQRHAGATVKEESFSDLSNLNEPVSFTAVVAVPRYLEEAAEGLAARAPEDFFDTGRMLASVASLEERKRDVIVGPPRRSLLRTQYVLPDGFRVKSVPSGNDVQSRFGRFRVTYDTSVPGKVVVERLIELSSPRVSVADYGEFRQFAASVNRLATERILFEKS